MKAVFDTNILIDYLNGIEKAVDVLSDYKQPMIGRITWLEVLAGADDAESEEGVRSFLRTFDVIELDNEIAELAVLSRRERRLRLPDAIILATAQRQGCLLITRNTKDFNRNWVEIRVPYVL